MGGEPHGIPPLRIEFEIKSVFDGNTIVGSTCVIQHTTNIFNKFYFMPLVRCRTVVYCTVLYCKAITNTHNSSFVNIAYIFELQGKRTKDKKMQKNVF
jgi:hypothetical protein